MTVLVVGATGATGRLLVQELLRRGEPVRAIVRSPDGLPESIKQHDELTLIQGNVLDFSATELAQHVQGCRAVASCLGHNLTLKGIYGAPRRLVTDATSRLCQAIVANASDAPTRFVLMNTAGNQNRDRQEPISFREHCLIGLIRCLLPPHVDNEQASDVLRTLNSSLIQWAAVRPDTLIDQDTVTDYDLHPAPTRSALFNPGKTSRINVAHFMAELITQDVMWQQWQGKMPVIYNASIN
ncbi:MAG: SDR family oxidoreductase [Natronospirillum sp.]